MVFYKYIFSIFTLSFLTKTVQPQSVNNSKAKFNVEVVGSAFTDSKRWFYYNGNDNVYSEIRFNVRFSKTVEAGIFVGHEKKSYIYFKQTPLSEVPLFIERQYIPAGIYGRINITDIFSEKLKWIKRREKWDIYNQVILAQMNGHDSKDERDDGQNIFYKYPYVIPYGRIYFGLLAGIKYHITPKFSLFLEAGDGAMMTTQIGAGFRF